jgi:predicted Ser/Thr protein kinase
MNEFRKALDAHVAGKLELGDVEREITLALARQPELAAAHGALVEALYRGGRIKGETYLALINVIRTFLKTQPRVEVRVVPPAGAAPRTATEDKTQFRAPKPAAPAAPAAPASEGEGEKTQFRPPRAASAAPPSNASAVAASTASSAPVPAPTPPASAAPAAPVSAPVAAVPPAGQPTGTGPYTDSRTPTGSRPTSSSWTDVGRAVADAPTLGAGSVVKDRFVLEEELGRGGMGVVFKARDLRKEEAQDRNPWVALKLLNEEFRRHPESLKALQRESRKAQQLAHANVVAVYDFDRDGGNVFMVMELLEGRSLDRIIRDNEGSGVGIEKAMRLTRDMCRAMAYAHEQGVVHSDFKPANAFLTKENVVKVFDFGIARAVKRTDTASSGSVTLFDPATLGALTPTYASCEMLEGLEPDPRDDVYAMACVAYELITGKHPFNRISAVEARNKGLVPKRPRGLKRQQWRAIQHGLEFNRDNRTASAQQFLNELIPRKGRATVGIGVAAVVVIGIVVAGFLVPAYLAKRRERAVIDALATADGSRLDALVQQLRGLTAVQRATILLNESARAGLIKAFEARIDAATEPNQANIDYPGAQGLLGELQGFLPDSLAVRDLADRLGARENDEINRLSDRFDDYLKRGLLIPGQGPQNIGTVLEAIRKIDAQNRLLHDPRLPGAFAEQTTRALQAGNTTLAQGLVAAGLTFDSGDPALADLRDQVQRALGQQQLLVRRRSLETSLAALTGANATFADIDAQRAQLEDLRGIAPDSAVLARVQQLAQRGVSAQITRLESTAQHAQALELIARYADLLPTSFVDQQRQKLASERGAFQAEQTAIAQIKSGIDTLLQSEKTDTDWSAQFDRELRQLTAYVSAADPYVVQAKARAAQAYVAEARTLRTSQRLTEAAGMLEQARKYAPQSVEAEAKLLADARSAQQAALQQRNRLAQVDALKTKLLVQARANEVNEALASLQELRTNLPSGDAYLSQQAPQAIGNAYLRLASNAARDGRFANAMSLTSRAKEISPTLQDLGSASERYGRYQVIEASLKTSGSIDGGGTRAELERLGRQDAREAAAVNERLATEFGARIRSLSDPVEAKRLAAVAQQIFGSELAARILSNGAANGKSLPTSQVPATPAGAAASASPGGESATSTGGGAAAVTPAAGAAGSAGGSASSTRTNGQNNTRLAMARPNSAAPADQAGAGPRLPPEIACSDRLAGYGRRRQAVCYDTFSGGGRGPDLVVVPPGGGNAKSFALGRTEVSNADYGTYCTRTGHCPAPTGQPDYPVTHVSLDDAKAYVKWLSQVTGETYRLPTDGEWTYAVTAQGGNTDLSSVNCLVEIGGKKVKGEALEPALSGSANGWGLYNALGNAQEWVLTGSEALVRGGAYSDNLSSCTLDAKRPHPDAGDAVTGLRVLRELP